LATQSTRRKRLEARITPEQKSLIERAAAYQARRVSDFMVQAVLEAAKAVVQEHEIVNLNPAESRAFVEIRLNPPEPNEEMRRAADEYRRDVIPR
jgi:uncharacterized protein (DUF1778 family)